MSNEGDAPDFGRGWERWASDKPLRAARDWGLGAIRALADSEFPQMSLAAGLVIEHLAKSILMTNDPGKIAPTSAKYPGSPEFLPGDGHARMQTLLDVRTIRLQPAVKAAMGAYGVDLDEGDLRDIGALNDVRNSAAHLGYSERDATAAAMGCFARIGQRLLGVDPDLPPLAKWLGIPDDLGDQLRLVPLEDDRDQWGAKTFGNAYVSRQFQHSWVLVRLWHTRTLFGRRGRGDACGEVRWNSLD